MITVEIKDLQLRTVIGTFDNERIEKQILFVDINFDYDEKMAAETDDLNYAVDYKKMTDTILDEIENENYFLLETTASKIMEIICRTPNLSNVKVKVSKPDALRFAETVSVVLTK